MSVAAGVDRAGARGAAGPGAAEVGVVSDRGFDALPASRMSRVTAANPTRNANTHAPASTRRRVRGVRSLARPRWSPGGDAARPSRITGSWCTKAWRTLAGETGMFPAFRMGNRAKRRRNARFRAVVPGGTARVRDPAAADREGVMEIGYSLASEELPPTLMADAGYDAVFVHQIGSDQEGFLRFYAEEVLPKV